MIIHNMNQNMYDVFRIRYFLKFFYTYFFYFGFQVCDQPLSNRALNRWDCSGLEESSWLLYWSVPNLFVCAMAEDHNTNNKLKIIIIFLQLN
ncbi:MAG: hypothetical protein EBZ58_00785 [Bacteroidetes bacterium]|nr:hypothetical protein [Bacteroidota bacterium]